MSSNLILVFATFLSLSVASIWKRDSKVGSVDLSLSSVGYYTANLDIGSNKDQVTLCFDTGSFYPNIFTVNTTCPGSCRSTTTFDPKNSTTFVTTGKNITTYYGDSKAYIIGDVASDDVTFGDITLKNYTFLDDIISMHEPMGILGVGPAISEGWSPIINAYKQGLISKPMYSLYLEDPSKGGGKFHMGGYDQAKLESDFTWFPYDPKSWQFLAHSDYWIINDQKIIINRTVAVDSGAMYGYIPDAALNQTMDALGDAYDANTRKIKCAALDGKTFTYSINGLELTLPLKSILYPIEDGEECYRSVLSGDFANLGGYFMRYIYFAFDYEKKLIGIAPLKNTTETNLVSF